MDQMTCPQCQADMVTHRRGGSTVVQCTACEGIFLAGAERGQLIEQENDWHLSSGPSTQPIPRITTDMTAPHTFASAEQARSYIDALFG
ncbi:MAG TPA: zf-TFIIB domain-containing protein [Nocardioidaceae bacterium]|nr:zf-TFIIB domain-containing protein [Nocardioidaceae bacterium]